MNLRIVINFILMIVNCLVFTKLNMGFEFHNERVTPMVLPYG